MPRSLRLATVLQFAQTTDDAEPILNSIGAPQPGQVACAMRSLSVVRLTPDDNRKAIDLDSGAMTNVGTEWLVDATGCDASRLSNLGVIRAILEQVISTLDLRVIGDGAWHAFPAEAGSAHPAGGVTGLYLLTESHVACHTYPERGAATFNVYCCRPRPEFPWEAELQRAIGASHVTVRSFDRG
jgi:S-adenosylmethionine decarboxylase